MKGKGSVQCDVFVDMIHSLHILTTVRKLVVGELESIEVQAYDKEGKISSTF